MLPAAPEQAPPSRPERASRSGSEGRGRRRAPSGLFEPVQLVRSSPEGLRKLHPRALVRNPVLFVVSVGAVLTTLSALLHPAVFTWVISLWLWLTVVFANLAEAVAEGRGPFGIVVPPRPGGSLTAPACHTGNSDNPMTEVQATGST
ncbi:hypothetical protein [Streptomyces sp. NPDC001135]